jgi:hypothetical protein
MSIEKQNPASCQTAVSGCRSFRIGDIVYHRSVYEHNEPLKVVGITEDKLLLEGDFSGGTHNVCQRDCDILKFKVLGKISEFPNNGDNVDEIVLLTIESYLDRISILSKIRDNITVQFDVSIYDKKMGDKSDIRDILIDQLV